MKLQHPEALKHPKSLGTLEFSEESALSGVSDVSEGSTTIEVAAVSEDADAAGAAGVETAEGSMAGLTRRMGKLAIRAVIRWSFSRVNSRLLLIKLHVAGRTTS